ncbi:AraC family transcriptional regulator [Limnobaculum parvum]|uniref:AraC family transcriptional regulator n=1 Tax=Limnobaculum parvum TaxID=2172103 RepID=A0A2Y9TXG8_9GAMM|nr:AraC family transcriptional regulator [Limnobaculum parvum]AWH88241.1 AraC family transcriptional regulator [Limnobaculum parvum]
MLIEPMSLLTNLVSEPQSICHIYFADNQQAAPDLAHQVSFPRLELVIEGSLTMSWPGSSELTMKGGDVLFIPGGGWNYPVWQQPVKTLSILFGKQQIGFSILYWDGKTFHNQNKQNVLRRGPRVGSFLLQALNELVWNQREQSTAQFIVKSLFSHCIDLLKSQVQTASRSQALFDVIRDHIDTFYQEPLTRESVAQAFYISPNYLSHLFRKAGGIGFNEYLNYSRLEQAKCLLKGYDMKVKEVAHACGFVDSNYFCRLFRKATERSPSEYRRQYHSQLTDKAIN